MNTLSSISFVTKTAFSNPLYLIIASIAGFVFWMVTNTFDNILFFSPYLAFYVPNDMLGVFILTCINSILVVVLVNFNLHIIRDLKLKISKSAVAGTTISVISSACATCSTFGFILASTFGGLAVVVSNFLSGNQIIIREISTPSTRQVNQVIIIVIFDNYCFYFAHHIT